MAVFKEIKERIGSIATTRKITAAMKMVSASKLIKVQRSTIDMVPYSASLNGILANILHAGESPDASFAEKRAVRYVAIVAFSSDGSLAGAFNSTVIKMLRRTIDKYIKLGAKNIHIYTIGKKVHEAAAKWECPIVSEHSHLAAKPDYDTAAALAMHLVDEFRHGEIDKVELIYQHFKSAGTQVLTHDDFLPIPPRKEDKSTPYNLTTNYIYEPSRSEVLAELLPMSFKLRMYTVWLDSAAAEHAARVVAMQTATDNADKLIAELTIQYNKSRQQSITNELLDIMGGSLR